MRSTRLAVEFILDLVAEGWSFDNLLENYPGLTVGDIPAFVSYARDVLVEVQVFPKVGPPFGR